MLVDIPDVPEVLFSIEYGNWSFGDNDRKADVTLSLDFAGIPVFEKRYSLDRATDRAGVEGFDKAQQDFRAVVAAKLTTIFQGA